MKTLLIILFVIPLKVVWKTSADTHMHFIHPLVCEYSIFLIIVGILALICGCVYYFRREDEADVYDFESIHPSGDN